MHRKFRIVPGRAVTLNVTGPPLPLGPMMIESPGASKPGAPTLTSGIGGGPAVGGPSKLIPCDFAIAAQALQRSTCLIVCGTWEALTIDRLCPSLVLFTSVTVQPDRIGIVPGAKRK